MIWFLEVDKLAPTCCCVAKCGSRFILQNEIMKK